MTPKIIQLQSLTAALLSPVLNYNECREAALSLSKLFSEAAGFDEMAPDNQIDIRTTSGKALAPRWAASCLVDFMRTRKFILGIRDAIEEKLKINPGRPVTVLYAGTGPFASLLTPLITLFTPAQLQMVWLEINPVSFQYLQKMITQFEMEDYVVELVEADAATWSIPVHVHPDIVVSETMNNALQKEPQVSIVVNLLSQCNPGTILIPDLVKVDACLLGSTIDHPEDIFHLETLLELDAETAVRIKKNPENVPVLTKGIILTISELPPERFKTLALNTSIRIFGQYSLTFNESGLTIPHILRMTNWFKKFPIRLLFQYQNDNNPCFRVSDL
jgi:predicted RNA methylase